MTDNELYYRQRMAEELAAARMASDEAISRVHRDMAELYRDLLGAEAGAKAHHVEPGTIVV